MSQVLAVRITEYLAGYQVPPEWDGHTVTPYTVFKNYSPGQTKGLRLTQFGWELIRGHFRYWTFQLPGGWHPTPGHLLGLEFQLEWPYYHSHGFLRVFSEQDAFEIRLTGDPVLWLDGLARKALAKV